MISTAQWLYMNEAEGEYNVVPTREARLNAVIRDIKETKPATFPEVNDIIEKHGLRYLSFNSNELQEVTNAVYSVGGAMY